MCLTLMRLTSSMCVTLMTSSMCVTLMCLTMLLHGLIVCKCRVPGVLVFRGRGVSRHKYLIACVWARLLIHATHRRCNAPQEATQEYSAGADAMHHRSQRKSRCNPPEEPAQECMDVPSAEHMGMQVLKDISDGVGVGGGAPIHRTSDNRRRGRGVRPETIRARPETSHERPLTPTIYYLHDAMRAPASLQASAHDPSSHQHRNETQRPRGSDDGRGSRVEGSGSRVQGRRTLSEGVESHMSHRSAFNLDNPRHAQEFDSWLGGLMMRAPEDIPTCPNKQNKDETHQTLETQSKGLLLANRGANLEVEAAEHAMLLRREESLRSMESQRSHFSRSSQSRYSHSDESQYSRYPDQSRSEYSEFSSASNTSPNRARRTPKQF